MVPDAYVGGVTEVTWSEWTVARAVPVPDKLITCGLAGKVELSATVREPFVVPATVGRNTRLTVQVPPGFKDPPAAHVPPVILNAAESLVIEDNDNGAVPVLVRVTLCPALEPPTTVAAKGCNAERLVAAYVEAGGAGVEPPPPPQAASERVAIRAVDIRAVRVVDLFIVIPCFLFLLDQSGHPDLGFSFSSAGKAVQRKYVVDQSAATLWVMPSRSSSERKGAL